jgi:hypothetical protein
VKIDFERRFEEKSGFELSAAKRHVGTLLRTTMAEKVCRALYTGDSTVESIRDQPTGHVQP